MPGGACQHASRHPGPARPGGAAVALLLALLAGAVLPAPGQTSGALRFEPIYVQKGTPPVNILNIRLRILNGGDEAEEGPMVLRLFVLEAGAADWRMLREWTDVGRLPAGHRTSRDFVGEATAVAGTEFDVKAVLRTPDGREVQESIHYVKPPIEGEAPASQGEAGPSPSPSPSQPPGGTVDL